MKISLSQSFIILSLFLSGLISHPVKAQNDIPIGTWRTHFSYFSAHQVVAGNGLVYSASKNGLFYFDASDNSTSVISKVNGLSDTGVSRIQYNPFNQLLLIGYTNGNIDLLDPDGLSNFKIIKEAETSGSKAFNEINFNNQEAFMAMDLGMVRFDTEKEEILESYINIGENGTKIMAFSSTLFQDSIYIATDQGILVASMDEEVNRLDFRNWQIYNENIGLPSNAPSFIKAWEGSLIIGYDNDSLYRNDGNGWNAFYQLDQGISSAIASSEALLVVLENEILSIDNQFNINSITNSSFYQTQAVAIDNGNTIWVADQRNGLLRGNGDNFSPIRPLGPFSDNVSKMINYDKKIVAISGTTDSDLPANNLEGFSVFENGIWSNFNSSGFSETITIPAINDLVDVAHNNQTNTTYFASFGSGVFVWDNEDSYTILDENSPGSTLINSSNTEKLTRISSLSLDQEGNLWMCNYATPRPIHLYNTAGEWQFYLPENSASQFTDQIVLPTSGEIWMRIKPNKGGKISLLNPESGFSSTISRNANEGQLVSNSLLDITEELSGQMWMGSAGGISYFQTSFGMTEANPKDFALRPFYDGFPLLANEAITSLAIDGGNRKWIGTENGLWLFGPDGENLFYNFTEDNSPLPSNNIIDICIEQNSGEVFIATEKGLVSYRGTSTEGNFEHQQVKVFPNPVTKDFTGTIGISGLTDNAIVKITSVSGKLVYETRAYGGMATWDGRDYNGRRAQSGMYLILSSNDAGDQTYVGKIAVID